VVPQSGYSSTESNWNLEVLIFTEGGKPENPEKNPRSKGENHQQTQLTYDTESGNRTRVTVVRGEHSHRYAMLPILKLVTITISNDSIDSIRNNDDDGDDDMVKQIKSLTQRLVFLVTRILWAKNYSFWFQLFYWSTELC
jgi:hypothetical protein